jgi:hypothetical protein
MHDSPLASEPRAEATGVPWEGEPPTEPTAIPLQEGDRRGCDQYIAWTEIPLSVLAKIPNPSRRNARLRVIEVERGKSMAKAGA